MSVYKFVELVGTSPTSWEDAARNVVAEAGRSLGELRIAEVVGSGLLREVWRRIEAQAEGEEPEARRIAERARLLLYQLAQEAQS